LYVEDLKRGTQKDIGPKDIFEMDSNNNQPPGPDSFAGYYFDNPATLFYILCT
jgi:hypothetical protein